MPDVLSSVDRSFREARSRLTLVAQLRGPVPGDRARQVRLLVGRRVDVDFHEADAGIVEVFSRPLLVTRVAGRPLRWGRSRCFSLRWGGPPRKAGVLLLCCGIIMPPKQERRSGAEAPRDTARARAGCGTHDGVGRRLNLLPARERP